MLNGERDEQLLLLVLLLGLTAIALILRSYWRPQPYIWHKQKTYPAKQQRNADHTTASSNETYPKHNANGRNYKHDRWEHACALFTIIWEKIRGLFPIVLIPAVYAWNYVWNCVKAFFCAIRAASVGSLYRSSIRTISHIIWRGPSLSLWLSSPTMPGIKSIRGTAALQEQARTLQGQLNELKAEARPWVTALNQITTMSLSPSTMLRLHSISA